MKKILLVAGALGLALITAPMFAAFEAHVVNVTATIENALSVPVDPLTFGTVFPQEHLDKTLTVTYSQSFMDQNRVDNVSYFIRQKPKCAWSWQDDNKVWNIDEGSTQTGHVTLAPTTDDPDAYFVDCGQPDKPANVPDDATWGQLPSLCEYISKHADTDVVNDESLNSFHQSFTVSSGKINWTDTDGLLDRSAGDTLDTWTIDLAVPCFGGYCAQDWADFVHLVSEDESIDPNLYTQPIENEHKVFGCDLWVEVDGVTDDNVI